MSKTNMLVLIEGVKPDSVICDRILNHDKKDVTISIYRTNIHSMYLDLKKTFGAIENVDFITYLHNKLGIPNIDYTDVILFFDFDPQDNLYNRDDLYEMCKAFSNKNDLGMLFINYPMVESFKHFKSIPDNEYLSRMINKDILFSGSYKKLVNNETFNTDVRKYTDSDIDYIVSSTLNKIENILNTHIDVNNLDKELQKLLLLQCNLFENGFVYVICTAVCYRLLYNKMKPKSKMDFALSHDSDLPNRDLKVKKMNIL